MPPKLLPAFVAGALALCAGLVQAETMNTLERIRKSGSIALGHRESSIPFSYVDDRNQVVGYSHDIALKILDAVRSELQLPELRVRLVSFPPLTRLPMVQNGMIDLECGSTSLNGERARQVAFSAPIFVINTRLMTRADSGIRDFADLAGKNVVTTAGTTSERLLRKLNVERQLDMRLISARDHGESFLQLESGRVAAFVMDDMLLYGERAKARKPQDWTVVGTPLSQEAYACTLRKDDPAFKALVDRTIGGLMQSGEINEIYRKWFMQPIPPKSLNLNFPASDANRALFRAADATPAH